MTKIYVYCKKENVGGNGEVPIYLLFKNGKGRFLVNTGITTSKVFTGRELPKTEKNRTAKSNALNRYILMAEEICLDNVNLSNSELKTLIKSKVFGKDEEMTQKTIDHYIDEYADRALAEGTASLYRSTAKRVRMFDGSTTFDSVNVNWLERFNKHLLASMEINSVAIEMRNIRAVFNRAIDDGVTSCYPFRKFRIKTEATRKRNLTVEQIRTLIEYPVEENQKEYRDIWVLQFLLAGINISDLVEAKSLTDGRFVYHRKKTGRLYDICVIPEAMEIIERYRGKDWLLSPLDRFKNATEYNRYMNKALKKIGSFEIVKDKVGKRRKKKYNPLFPDISTYWNRHSWATIAASIDIPKEVIGKALGHSEWDNTTTDIYIQFDNKKIDDAIRKVADYVLYRKDYRKKDGQ